MVQNAIKMIFRRQRSPQSHFLMIFWQFWSKKIFWKKKFKNAYKWPKMSIFDLQMDQNFQILILSNVVKNCMKTIFENKKSPQKPFFMIWGQKKFFEKKSVNFAQKNKKNAIFRNFCGRFFGRKQTKSADLWPEGPLGSQVPPKCFLSQTDKNSWFYLKKTSPPPKTPF